MTLAQLLSGTLAALIVGTVMGQVLRRTARTEPVRATVANINARIAAWWVLCGVTALALLLGAGAVCVLFAVFSALGVRELAPRPTSLLLALTALQYGLVWQGVFLTAMPVAALLAIAIREMAAADTARYLERVAENYCAFLIAVYLVSFAAALHNPTLLFYFLLVVQAGDVLQYCWGKLVGRRPVAPRISPNKTWEGFVGGTLTATALGTALYRATPFGPYQAAAICVAISLAGFAGGLTMSAIKRRRGIKDFGTLVKGHGGMMDRMDSLCFSAPVFYLAVRLLADRVYRQSGLSGR